MSPKFKFFTVGLKFTSLGPIKVSTNFCPASCVIKLNSCKHIIIQSLCILFLLCNFIDYK